MQVYESIIICYLNSLYVCGYNITLKRIDGVGSRFRAQAQQVWGSGPRSPKQWIYREWAIELGLNEVYSN